MVAPTAEQVQGWTKVTDFANAADADAERYVARANAAFRRITGLRFEDVDSDDVPLVEQAVQGLSESIFYDNTEDRLETLSDFDLIKSFGAGPYNETRRGPEEAMKARLLHPWPWLSSLLWQLLTEDKYDYWMEFFGGNAPASEIIEVDWSGGIGMPGSDLPTGGMFDPWRQ